MRVLIDTREPGEGNNHPWAAYFSEDVKVERGTLETGDFALAALPDSAVIERKTAPDLYACLGRERERFERELQRGRYVGRLVVVVESNLSDVLTLAQARGGGMSVASILGTLASWQRRFAPFFFAGTPANAAQFTERLLRGQVREIERAAKSLQAARVDGNPLPVRKAGA